MENRDYQNEHIGAVEAKINVVPIEYVNKRFDSIDKKLDVLSQAMIDLARTEEKLLNLQKEGQLVTDRLNAQSHRIDQISDLAKENSRITNNISRVTWVVVTVIVGLLAKLLFLT